MHSSNSSTPRDPALDGLRGVAVLLVFLFHYGGGLRSTHPLVHALGVVTEAGWIGVVIFFALSGFLITGGLWDSRSQPHWLRNFFARRALRILPLYFAALALALVLALLRGTPLAGLRHIALFALFLQNVPLLAERALNNPSPLPLYHLWSLAVEEQFYLLWPLLLLFARRRSAAAGDTANGRISALALSLGVFVFSILFCVAVYIPGDLDLARWIQPSALPQFDYFLATQCGALALGAALALILRIRHRSSRERSSVPLFSSTLCFALGLALFLIVSFTCGNFYLNSPLQFIVGLPAVALAATALIPIAMHRGVARSLLSSAPLLFVGRISYGFYIIQVMLQPVVHRIALDLLHTSSGNLYFGVRFVIALTLSLAAAWLSFRFFELPVLRWKSRFPMHQPLP